VNIVRSKIEITSKEYLKDSHENQRALHRHLPQTSQKAEQLPRGVCSVLAHLAQPAQLSHQPQASKGKIQNKEGEQGQEERGSWRG
jgi:hypothetical protein